MTDDSSESISPQDSSDEEVSRGTGLLAQPEERESGNYLDFEIEIGRGSGRQYPLAVIHSPAGEARETLNFPFDEIALETRLKNLEIALLRSGGARRQVLSPEEQSVQDFGLQLFASLFSGEARTRYDMSSDIARQRGLGLRLKLRIQAPELARLPWEFLYDPRQGEYICMSRDTPIVRYIELPQPIKPLTVEPPLRILGMISSPSNLPHLDVQREKLRLEKAIARLQAEKLVRLTWLASATWRELQRAMRSGPWHIFHFIGHGGFEPSADEGIIALEDESSSAQLLLATELGRLLADHRSLRLVLLNACEGARGSQHDIFSSSAAVLVRRGLPAVLAMQYAITDRAAIEFSRSFYEALADGLPVDAAVCEARKAVSLSITNTIEWGTPVLYMRSPQGVIFELPVQAHREHSTEQTTSIADKEEQAQIERLYTEGRAAFWVEDWERACVRFQAILNICPDHPEATTAFEESQQSRQRAELYAQALAALHAEKWEETIGALEELSRQAPGYKDVAALLQTTRTKKLLADLYEEARKLYGAKQWQAVVRVFEQLHSLQSDFPDPDGVLSSAEKEVAKFERQAVLEADYSQAIHSMDAGRWQDALSLLEKVQVDEPGYREVESLLDRIRGEVEKAQKNRKIQEQVNTLYEQAHGLVRARQWRKALDKLDAIYKMDESFADSDGLAGKVKTALEHDEQEAQRQNELSRMYAEAFQLLKDEQYQQALEKWCEIHAWDPKFPDRQKIQRAAKKKLAELGKPTTTNPVAWASIKWRRVGQIVALVVALVVLGIVIAQSQPTATATVKTQTEPKSVVSNTSQPTKPSATATPRSTATRLEPTSAILYTDPTMYDDFNNPAFSKKFNTALWTIGADSSVYKIAQFDGKLSITLTSINGAGLVALRRQHITKPMFFETKAYLDPDTTDNGCHLFVQLLTEQGYSNCGVFKAEGKTQNIRCWSEYYGKKVESNLNLDGILPGWHVFRFEIEPDSMIITYVIDGRAVGFFDPQVSIPDQLNLFKRLAFGFKLALNNFGPSKEPVGYFDNVRIGAIADDPTNYDNFNDNKFDGGYNHVKWQERGNSQNGSIYQENDILIIRQTGERVERALYATKKVKIENSQVAIDFNLKINPSVSNFVILSLENDFLHIGCAIHGMQDEWIMHCWYPDYDAERGISIKMGQWHHNRILIDPATKTFTFYIDGELHDRYTYRGAQSLKFSQFDLALKVTSHTNTQEAIGYFDNIRIEIIDE